MTIDTTVKRTIVDAEFEGLPTAEQIRHFETEGYVILPKTLDAELISQIERELADLPMRGSFINPEPTFAARQPQWHSPACARLIAHPPTVGFLHSLMGSDLIFTHGHYIIPSKNADELPPLPMHSDYKPYGSTYSRWEESCPVRVRVLYYLGESTLGILPRSHISFHADAHPYRRYASHPDTVGVNLQAGTAFIFAVRLFHGAAPKQPGRSSTRQGGMLEIDYRPAWSRPVMPVDEWLAEDLAKMPEESLPYLKSPNTCDEFWEFKPMETEEADAPGLSPYRWES